MKVLSCPACGEKIIGETEEEVMQNGMAHGREAGHPEPSDEQLEQIKDLSVPSSYSAVLLLPINSGTPESAHCVP